MEDIMNNYGANATIQYSHECSCGGVNARCAKCKGLNVVPTDIVTFNEMQIGVTYMVEITESDIGACVLTKMNDWSLACTYFFLDGNGDVSEASRRQTIEFKIGLLYEMRKMRSSDHEIDFFVEHLRNYRLYEAYDLDTLANTVALGIYEAVLCNYLRDHDMKHGTSLRSFITVQPVIDDVDMRDYKALVRYVVKETRVSQVTMVWALRQYEIEKGVSIMQILFDAEKTFQQLTCDSGVNR